MKETGLPERMIVDVTHNLEIVDEAGEIVCTTVFNSAANRASSGPELARERKRLAAELVRRWNQHEALMQLWRESECYCADYVAAKGSCAHCAVRATLATPGKEGE